MYVGRSSTLTSTQLPLMPAALNTPQQHCSHSPFHQSQPVLLCRPIAGQASKPCSIGFSQASLNGKGGQKLFFFGNHLAFFPGQVCSKHVPPKHPPPLGHHIASPCTFTSNFSPPSTQYWMYDFSILLSCLCNRQWAKGWVDYLWLLLFHNFWLHIGWLLTS